MIAIQSFEVLKIMNSLMIKSDRISAECGLQEVKPNIPLPSGNFREIYQRFLGLFYLMNNKVGQ
jgi:hypothetical protein